MKNKGYAKVWGANKVYYGRCTNVQMVNLQKFAYSRRICTSEFVVVFKLQNNNVCSFSESTLCLAAFYRNRSLSVGWIGWAISCSIEKKEFLVSLVDQLFQPALGSVENDVWYLSADLLYGISRDVPSSFR